MKTDPIILMNKMVSHEDPNVREFAREFKTVVRSLYALKTCSHVYQGSSNTIAKIYDRKLVTETCRCAVTAGATLSKWMLAMQD